jgi:protein ImuB
MPLAEAQALLEPAPSRDRQGAVGGGPLSDGRGSYFIQHDPQADRKLLQLLAGWCSRYSPLVGMEQTEEPSTLFFDITGCATLFGGEEALAEQVVHDFERAGYLVRIAIADTPGAAWAAVHFAGAICSQRAAGFIPAESGAIATAVGIEAGAASEIFSSHGPMAESSAACRQRDPAGINPAARLIIPLGRQSALLENLPVAALRLAPETIEMLEELGLRQVGQLQNLPRKSLPARFGREVLERLDQALGLAEELIVPVPPAEPIEADWSFEEPTADRRALESVLTQLLSEVSGALAARQEGAQQLICRLSCVGKEPLSLTIGSVRPTAAAEHLLDLARLQLERISLAGELLRVHLEVTASAPIESQQHEFFNAGLNREGEKQLAVLLDRLSSRLGEQAVLRPRLCPDPQPEYASRLDMISDFGFGISDLRSGGVRNAEWGMRNEIYSAFPTPHSALSSNPKSAIPNPKSSFAVPDYQFTANPAVRPLCLKPRPVAIEVVSVVPDGPPIRFRWRAGEYVIERHWGPERIETGWWRGAHVRRDYYRVETTTGERFWLFRENDTGRWFLHGTFE